MADNNLYTKYLPRPIHVERLAKRFVQSLNQQRWLLPSDKYFISETSSNPESVRHSKPEGETFEATPRDENTKLSQDLLNLELPFWA